MDEQILAWPLNASAASRIQNPQPIPFDQELMKMDHSNRQFSYGERLGALTQIYLALGLRLQVALRAAEADLCQLYAQKFATC